uniref:Reverse transcriptase Ty1/copia-type domain-containing protein n=1 Tax=Tanacetum cinerariifolium TaxID=118510 RepID=A0A699HL45_TANCI|nr:hypothetical protein [Tanacetum cinerariifolium]
MNIIGTKGVFRNKLDENDIVSRNKARSVAQGYNQQEGIDYDESYAPVARLESIRILLAYACALDFKLFQMDVKSALLNGFINEEYKYIKEMLKKFGLEESKPMKTPMSSDTKLTKDEECESADSTKYRGTIGSVLYLTASRPDIMFSVCLCVRFQEAPKTSHLEVVKRIFQYIKDITHLGLWYPKGTGIETVVYADSDHAGDYVDRKSTSGICTFVGCCLTSWFLKKQMALAISTTEAEYVSAEMAYQQALWMKQTLIDYDVRLDDVSIMCDNKGTIDLSKNPVQHSRTKHIKIRHHFLRDNVQKGHISIKNMSSIENIIDILTKPLKPSFLLFLSSSSSSNHPTKDSTQASSSNPSKKIKLTIIPPRKLFVNISSDKDVTTTPSHITTSSFPSSPNAPSKTLFTKDISSTFGTTSSTFKSKPQSLPPTSNDIPSPQPSNPFLENVMDASPRPSHPLPLQSHPSFEITLSLSLIAPLDHILDTLSPPSLQPQPQPPLMGHPIYFNYHDYHGSTCFCCFHNHNLIFSLRDEMNLMFAHIEYLLTSTMTSLSSRHP